MRRRKLGKSELEVPVIALGGVVYGWTLSEADAFRQLDAALDAGLNFVDTADTYSRWVPGNIGGESETILGRWFAKRGRRADLMLATKVGGDMGKGRQGLKAAYIIESVEGSLRRLQTDYIDLYQAHVDDADTLLEETLLAFEALVQSGKVRFIGASHYTGARLAQTIETSRRLGVAEYVSLQPHYNLVERHGFESDLLPVVRKYDLGVIPYFSLAAGFLTGKYRTREDTSARGRGGTVQQYLNEFGFGILDALDQVARERSATPTQVALAWLIARPGITAPIASATDDRQLRDLVAAAELTLNPQAIATLDAASTPRAVEA